MLEQATTETFLVWRDSDMMAGMRESALRLFHVAFLTAAVSLPSDVAVGAPMEDDFSGAVYIYHGDADGIVPQYSMVMVGEGTVCSPIHSTFLCATPWGPEARTTSLLPLALPPSSERHRLVLLMKEQDIYRLPSLLTLRGAFCRHKIMSKFSPRVRAIDLRGGFLCCCYSFVNRLC